MNYLSMCSGIEAASVAWEWLGWKPIGFAEIERYPSAVLAYHYPSVPNYGDMRGIANRILLREIEAPDVIVAGTPCQSYSIAGNRGSLNDERGQLTLSFVQCAAAVDTIRARDGKPACVITWENVPGVLSTHDNAFGCFLAGLAGEDVALLPPGKRWPDAGCVYGPKRAVAWRILDAQYFGLAQRRKRVFVVASARAGFDPAEVLFEWQGVRRDSAPSRGARENTAGTLAGGARRRGGYSHDDIPAVAHCLNAGGMGSQDSESESMIIATSTGRGWWDKNDIAASMRAQDSANKADTLIAHPLRAQHNASLRADSDTYVAFNHNAQACQLPGESRDTSVVDALTCSQGAAVAFTCKDYGADAGEISPTLRAMGHTGSHANAGGQVAVCVTGDLSHALKAEGADASEDGTGRGNPIVAVAFQSSQSGVRSDDVHATLDSNNGSRRHNGAVTQQGVRRLTVRECEILMGFPSVTDRFILELCLDRQKNCVHAVIKCRRSPSNVWRAGEFGSRLPVDVAASHTNTDQERSQPLVALHVLTSYGDGPQEFYSQGRLIWSASSAGQFVGYPRHTQVADSVAGLAQLLREQGLAVRAGKAESQQSINLSMPENLGEISVLKSGGVSEEFASDAEPDVKTAQFTTSELGQLSPKEGSPTAIWLCSVLRAIGSSIPSEMLPENFSLEVSVETPYTLIPYGKGMAADGPRYKALGNSKAVPIVRWIGQRIQMVIDRLEAAA